MKFEVYKVRKYRKCKKVLENMQKKYAHTTSTKRDKARRSHNQKSNIKWDNFKVGDFVLVGIVTPKKNKLAI